MFYQGSHKVTLDTKSRIAVPAGFRRMLDEQCAGDVTITMGIERELFLYPRGEWLAQRARLPRSTRAEQMWRRRFIGAAHDLSIDGAGRIVIPAVLRERAGLASGAVNFSGDVEKLIITDWDGFMAGDQDLSPESLPDGFFGDQQAAANGVGDA